MTPTQTAREIVAPLRQGLGPVILHRSVLADLVDWTERRIAAALTRDAVAVLHQIVTVCDDNRTATYPELALMFVRDVAAEALAAAPAPLGASSMLDWKLSDDTKECLREIDHNSAMAAANAGSFLVGAAPPPAAERAAQPEVTEAQFDRAMTAYYEKCPGATIVPDGLRAALEAVGARR